MGKRILASVSASLLAVLVIAPAAHAQQQAVRSYIDGENAYRAGDMSLAEQKFRDCLNSPDVPRDRGSKVRLVSQQYGFYPEVYLALIYQQQRRYQDVLTYAALAKRYIKSSDPLYIVFGGAEAEARRMLTARGGADDNHPGDVGPVLPTAGGARQYALVIGIDHYDDPRFPTLKTAVADASDIARVLHDRYGFDTKFLKDPDRHDILTALDGYRRVLSDSSSLLIYYAGHGNYDSGTDRAYWLPRDAESLSTANWISADDITNDIRGMAARHVIVISDSCYSGGLTRDAPVEVAATEHSRYV
ncbi:MAG TPA: caspase family protein, partial [Vicinamibacterales bacterium]|nr:caspase family protein [Vicinamibacterales bacterium]